MTHSQHKYGISIILCTYNNAQFLERCIASILDQKYDPIEVIILDDASTDNTQEILRPFKGNKDFKLLKNDKNLGLTKSLNIAIAAAQHELIARIDADDVMLPGRLAYQAQCFRDLDIILTGSNAELHYEDEGFVLTPSGEERFFRAKDAFLSNPFAHSTVMFTKKAYVDAGGYDERFAKCQDFDLWKRMKDHGRLHLSATNLSRRSIHNGMITRNNAWQQFKYTQKIRFRNLTLALFLPAILKMIKDISFIYIPRFIKRIFIWKQHTAEVVRALQLQNDKPIMLHLCTSMQIGGAQIAMASMLSNESYSSSYRSCVISFREGSNLIPQIQSMGTPVANFRINGLISGIFAYFYLRHIIKQTKPVFVYSWLYHTHLISILAKINFPSVQVFWAIHSWKREFLSKKSNTIVSICAKASRWVPKTIVYASEASRDIHKEYGFADNKAIVIANGTRFIAPQPQLMCSAENTELAKIKGKIVIGTVSRFVVEKDIQNFIAMASKLNSKYQNIHFVLIGAGLSKDNGTLCSALEKVSLLDKATLIESSTDLGTWFKRMDVFCLTSKSEAFPLVLGEAILSGTIPVTTDVGDVQKIIPETITSSVPLIVPTGNASAFAQSVDHVINLSADKKENCIKQLREHIITNFSEDKFVLKHIRMFNS